MRNISNAFRDKLAINTSYLIGYADITLSSGTVLALSNSEIWTNGIQTEDAVSEDDEFSALGSTIIGSATVIINNIDDTYSEYDFTGAKVVLSLGMEFDDTTPTTIEVIKLGTYTVDTAIYNGTTITLNVLDNMEQFDRPYVTNLAYPATLDSIVQDACLKCGVVLNTYNFPHKNYTVQTKPDNESTTFRDVIGWAATIAGCFARCDVDGRLELKWFNQVDFEELWQSDLEGGHFDTATTVPYPSGDDVDGGTFSPWNTGDVYDSGYFSALKYTHYLVSLYSQDIEIDDAVITGVKLYVKDKTEGSNDTIQEYLSGTDDYVIEISNNEFITINTAQTVVTWLGNQLNGLRFRKVNVSHVMDPTIEAGDIGLVIDYRKQRKYPILVTRTNFEIASAQTTVCGASTPSRNSSTRYSSQTKSYVESKKLLNRETTLREQQIAALSESLAEASGLYSTIQPTTSGNIYYLHDKTTLEESKIVWKMTTDAWGVTTNYDGEHPAQTVWNAGMTVDGDTIVRILTATGVNADWIYSGTLTLGGQNNANGQLRILDSSGTRVGLWDNSSLYIGNISGNLLNANTQIDSAGNITTKSLTADDYIYVDGNEDSYLRIPFTPYGGVTADGYIELWDKGLHAYVTYSLASERVRHVRIGSSELSPSGGLIYEIAPVTVASSFYFDTASKMVEIWDDTITVDQNHVVKVSLSTSGSNFYAPVTVNSNFTVSGTKSRNVSTKDYGERLLYCYETPSPLFGDVGEGTIGDDGKCYIQIDSIFAETISLNQYQVFLQKYGNGDCWVADRKGSYFIVEGTPNLSFGWELKAKQSDFDQSRLDKNEGRLEIKDYSDYAESFLNHIEQINKERESVLND